MSILSVFVHKEDYPDDEPWENEIYVPPELTDVRTLMLIGFGLAFEGEWCGGDDDIHVTVKLDGKVIHED